jgi:hypothetical protein
MSPEQQAEAAMGRRRAHVAAQRVAITASADIVEAEIVDD